VISCFRHRKTLRRFSAMFRSNSSAESSAVGLKTPASIEAALLNAQSRRPKRATAARTSASTCSAFETSVRTKSALASLAASISRTTASPASAPRLAITTFAPSRANASAAARPMPELPPVTSTTLPRNSPSDITRP